MERREAAPVNFQCTSQADRQLPVAFNGTQVWTQPKFTSIIQKKFRENNIMALTENQQTSILQIAQAMFNATPGAVYLKELASLITSGLSIASIGQALAGNKLFIGKNYADDLTPEAFAAFFVTDLIGDHVSNSNKTVAINYIVSRMTAGATQGEIIAEATNILSAFPSSDPDWGQAALHYNTDNATKIVDNLLGDTVAAADKAWAVDYILAQMASGQTFGAIIEWAINALDSIDYADPPLGQGSSFV